MHVQIIPLQQYPLPTECPKGSVLRNAYQRRQSQRIYGVFENTGAVPDTTEPRWFAAIVPNNTDYPQLDGATFVMAVGDDFLLYEVPRGLPPEVPPEAPSEPVAAFTGNFCAEVASILQEAMQRATAVNKHGTVWVHSDTYLFPNGTIGPLLLFFSCTPGTIAKATEALDKAGVLCHTNLGTLAQDDFRTGAKP